MGVILETLPLDEQQVSARHLDTPIERESDEPWHGRDDRLGPVERLLERALLSGPDVEQGVLGDHDGILPDGRVTRSVRARMPVVALIRDARPDEALALESLQRRSSDVSEEYRAQLAAHPDAIAPPHQAIAEGRVRVAVDASGQPLGFSVVRAVEDGRCELDDL